MNCVITCTAVELIYSRTTVEFVRGSSAVDDVVTVVSVAFGSGLTKQVELVIARPAVDFHGNSGHWGNVDEVLAVACVRHIDLCDSCELLFNTQRINGVVTFICTLHDGVGFIDDIAEVTAATVSIRADIQFECGAAHVGD